MTTWIPLTETDLTPLLTAAQGESLAARPHQDTPNDALTRALATATERIRRTIRDHELGVLSHAGDRVPPELQRTALHLALLTLADAVAGFILTDAQLDAIDDAEDVLDRIRSGLLPVSLPDDPEPGPGFRSAVATEVINRRAGRLSASRLRAL